MEVHGPDRHLRDEPARGRHEQPDEDALRRLLGREAAAALCRGGHGERSRLQLLFKLAGTQKGDHSFFFPPRRSEA